MKMFAIGMKGWTEIRKCRVIPKKVETKTVVESSRREPYYTYDDDSYCSRERWRTVPTKTTIHTIVYEGGRVVGTMKSSRFAALTNVSLRNGGIIQLRPGTYNILLKELNNE